MSAENDLRRAIQWMQDGDVTRAVAELQRLVSEPALDAKGRAAAYVWLAESRDDPDFKLRCLERALEYDPDSAQIQQALNLLRPARPQPPGLPPPKSSASSTHQLEQPPPVVAISGGANGAASATFVNSSGLLATTSYAIGSALSIQLRSDGAPATTATVLRRFPLHDLALIATPFRFARKPALAPPVPLAENTPILAHCADGTRLRASIMPLDRSTPRHWLGTNLSPLQIPDAGGNPLYDESGQLLGILTRNTDSLGNALAIKAPHLMALAERHSLDKQLNPKSRTCSLCGGLTRARLYGGTSCEICGARLSVSKLIPSPPPQPDQLRQLYGENRSQPCPHCDACLGHYQGRCLRCGHLIADGTAVPA